MNSKMNLVDINIPEGIESIDNLVENFKKHQCLMAALESGFLQWLNKNDGSTREQIIQGTKLQGAFSRSFLGTLVNLGLIKSNGDKYSNTDLSNTFLLEDSEYYQGNWMKINTGNHSDWNDLTNTIFEVEPKREGNLDKEYFEIKALEERSLRGELKSIIKSISDWTDFSDAKKILDLGDEKGLYSVALCQLNPNLNAIVLSEPKDIESAKEYIKKNGLQNQIEVLDINTEFVKLDSDYDIILVSHILYKHRRNLEGIFNHVYHHARDKGLVLFNHWFCGPGCEGTNNIQEIDKSLFSGGHPLCHSETFPERLEKCNFDVINVLDIPSYNGISKLHVTIKG